MNKSHQTVAATSAGRSEEPDTSMRPSSMNGVSGMYKYVSATLAFVIWGGWAWFINSQEIHHQGVAPVISGLVQGTASCMITLIMVRAVTRLYDVLADHRLRLFLPACMTTLVTGSIVITAHTVAGTANIPATVAPGLIVAFCFNVVTAIQLQRQQKHHALAT